MFIVVVHLRRTSSVEFICFSHFFTSHRKCFNFFLALNFFAKITFHLFALLLPSYLPWGLSNTTTTATKNYLEMSGGSSHFSTLGEIHSICLLCLLRNIASSIIKKCLNICAAGSKSPVCWLFLYSEIARRVWYTTDK